MDRIHKRYVWQIAKDVAEVATFLLMTAAVIFAFHSLSVL